MPELELCRLVRNGNSTHVSIPKPFLQWLQWRTGETVILVPNADRTVTIVRLGGEELAELRRARTADAAPAEAHP